MEPKRIVNRKLAFNPNDENHQKSFQCIFEINSEQTKGNFQFLFYFAYV